MMKEMTIKELCESMTNLIPADSWEMFVDDELCAIRENCYKDEVETFFENFGGPETVVKVVRVSVWDDLTLMLCAETVKE